MTHQRSLLKPSIELLIAAVFWGFGFIATIWTLPYLSPAAILSYRFLTAFIVATMMFPFLGVRREMIYHEFRFAIFSGLSLGLCLFLQTWGLESTSATNSGFITTLYVVFVPFVARLFLKEKLHGMHWLFVVLACGGTLFMVRVDHWEMNRGDYLTLACAAVAAIQIVYIGWVGQRSKNSFVLNTLQNFWAGIPFLLAFPLDSGRWDLGMLDSKAWLGLASLTFGSTLLAFFLQIRAQKNMPPSLASLFFLLESPFACLFALLLIGETVTRRQIMGASLIFMACFAAVWMERLRRRQNVIQTH